MNSSSTSPFGNSKVDLGETASTNERLCVLGAEILRDSLEVLVRDLVNLQDSFRLIILDLG